MANEWKLMPVELTGEMIAAGHQMIDWCRNGQKTNTPDDASQTEGGGTSCAKDLHDAWAAMQAAAPPAPDALPIDTALKDGTMLRLLVDYSGEDADHPIEDSAGPTWTIGFNILEDTGEDEWHIAGWCWSHDHFTEGRGTPVGWLPFHAVPLALSDTLITDFWHENYVNRDRCGLCGNTGRIDTRGTKAPTGFECGGVFYCLCPNGRALAGRGQEGDS